MLVNIVRFVAWLLLQWRLTRRYPVVYSSTALMSMDNFVQEAALALLTQRTASEAWWLRGTVEIPAVVYCAGGRVRDRVPDADMLRGEEGSGVHRRLQPSVPDVRRQPSTWEACWSQCL